MEEEEENDANSVKFAKSIIDQVDRSDIEAMVQTQRDMLSRYEKTNEMLINFNLLSLSRYEATSQEFKKHTQVLYEMKKDLDNVFRRIRVLKQRLGTMYPEAFSVCSDVYNMLSDEEDDEGKKKTKDHKHSKDQNHSVSNDGMNDMLRDHGKLSPEQNGQINCDKTLSSDDKDFHSHETKGDHSEDSDAQNISNLLNTNSNSTNKVTVNPKSLKIQVVDNG